MPPIIGEIKKQRSSVIPLFAVLLFGATFVAGYKVGTMRGVQGGIDGYDSGYAAGVAAATERVRAAGLLPETRAVMALTGTVVSVDASGMVIEVPQVVSNPFDESAPTTRTVRFGGQTAFYELMQKPPEEIRKALEAAATTADPAKSAPPAPVEPFTKKTLKPSDITVGATVSVTAAEDILRAATFEATEVNLVQRPSPKIGAPVTPDGSSVPVPQTLP